MMKRQRRATTGSSSASCASNSSRLTSRSALTPGSKPREVGGTGLALRPPLVVLGAGQLAWGTRVADDHRQLLADAHRLAGQRAAVEQQGMPGRAQHGGVLVEDPAGHAHELVLDPLAQQRQLERLELHPADVGEGQQRHRLDGRRRRQAAAEGHGAVQQPVEAGEVDPIIDEHLRRTTDVVGPGRGGVVLDMVEAELRRARQVQRGDADHAGRTAVGSTIQVSRSTVMVATKPSL